NPFGYVTLCPSFFYKRNKQGTGQAKSVDAAIQCLDSFEIGTTSNRSFCTDNPYFLISCRIYRRPCPRLDYTYDGDRYPFPNCRKTYGRYCVAGDHKEFYIL